MFISRYVYRVFVHELALLGKRNAIHIYLYFIWKVTV